MCYQVLYSPWHFKWIHVAFQIIAWELKFFSILFRVEIEWSYSRYIIYCIPYNIVKFNDLYVHFRSINLILFPCFFSEKMKLTHHRLNRNTWKITRFILTTGGIKFLCKKSSNEICHVMPYAWNSNLSAFSRYSFSLRNPHHVKNSNFSAFSNCSKLKF